MGYDLECCGKKEYQWYSSRYNEDFVVGVFEEVGKNSGCIADGSYIGDRK